MACESFFVILLTNNRHYHFFEVNTNIYNNSVRLVVRNRHDRMYFVA